MDKLQDISAPIGRLFLSMIFIFSGFSKITGYAATAGYMESVGVPGILLPLVIALELLGGIAILIGFKARLISLLFVGFNIVSALLFHQFWNDESQMNPFMKNIAMAGGFLMIFAHGPGAYSVDKDPAPRRTTLH
jgi:putative oxidoreductase